MDDVDPLLFHQRSESPKPPRAPPSLEATNRKPGSLQLGREGVLPGQDVRDLVLELFRFKYGAALTSSCSAPPLPNPLIRTRIRFITHLRESRTCLLAASTTHRLWLAGIDAPCCWLDDAAIKWSCRSGHAAATLAVADQSSLREAVDFKNRSVVAETGADFPLEVEDAPGGSAQSLRQLGIHRQTRAQGKAQDNVIRLLRSERLAEVVEREMTRRREERI